MASETKIAKPEGWMFGVGDLVGKPRGANWRGRVVGFYSTSLTPEGYAIESVYEPGSVQIFPLAALAPLALSAPEKAPEPTP